MIPLMTLVCHLHRQVQAMSLIHVLYIERKAVKKVKLMAWSWGRERGTIYELAHQYHRRTLLVLRSLAYVVNLHRPDPSDVVDGCLLHGNKGSEHG